MNKKFDGWALQDGPAFNYLVACKRAATDENSFKVFKQDPQYRYVLEHVGFEESLKYLNNVEIDYLDKLDKIKENDLLGTPDIFEYPVVGKISPTTLRYLKNTSDIIKKFGTDFKSIVEIGGGYGGLCKTISNFIDFENYLLIDIEEVNMLSRKYLSYFNIPSYSYRSEEITVDENFDLLISNYAFSECNRETQLEYIEKFIKRSNKFYMMYTDFVPENIHYQEFVEIVSEYFDIEYYADHGDPDQPKVMFGILK